MKIGMMTAWNQTSGVSTHAELVGRKWVEQGHDLRVFSFIEKDYHGRSLIGEDESYNPLFWNPPAHRFSRPNSILRRRL